MNKIFWSKIDFINNRAHIEDNAKEFQKIDNDIPFILFINKKNMMKLKNIYFYKYISK